MDSGRFDRALHQTYAADLGLRSERSWNPAQEPVRVVRVRPALEVPECSDNECPFTQIDAPEGDW